MKRAWEAEIWYDIRKTNPTVYNEPDRNEGSNDFEVLVHKGDFGQASSTKGAQKAKEINGGQQLPDWWSKSFRVK